MLWHSAGWDIDVWMTVCDNLYILDFLDTELSDSSAIYLCMFTHIQAKSQWDSQWLGDIYKAAKWVR